MALVLAIGVFAADLMTPLGAAAGVAYVAAVLVGGWRSGPGRPQYWAALCTVLAAVGYVFSPPGVVAWLEPASRALAVFAAWATAALLVRAAASETRRRQGKENHHARMEALKAGHERLKSAFDNAAVPMGLTDSEGRWILVNRAATDMLGYSPDELLDLDRHDITDPEDDEKSRNLFERVFAGDSDSFRCEKRYRRKDGRKVWADVSVSLVRAADGAPLYAIGHMQDITERKLAEHALRASEERYALAIKGANDGLWDWDLVKDETYISPRVSEIFGTPPGVERMPSSETLDHIHPDDVEGVKAALAAHLKGETEFLTCEFRTRRADLGGERWVLNRALALRGADGRALRMAGSVTDITERKRAEAALQRHGLIYEQMSDGIVIAGLDGKIVDCNSAAQSIFGYSKEELLGRERTMFQRPRETAHGAAGIADGIRHHERWSGEMGFVRKDGSEGICETVVVPLQDADGHVIATIGVNRDVTERRRAEEALRDSERRLRLVADNLPALVSYVDVTRRYRFVNKHHKEWFGVEAEDAIGRHVKDVIGERLYGRIAARVDEVLAGKEVTHEGSFELASGKVRHFQATYVPHIGASDEVLGYFALAQDVTERKRAEVELRFANDRADAASRAKSTFLSSMSHEFRTPLNAILGFGQLLEVNTNTPLGGSQTEFVGHIMKAGTHLRDLINEILELSNIESGALTVSLDDVALGGLFPECLKLIEPMSKKYGVETFGRFEADGLPWVRADGSRLKQVVLHLLSNAVKYNRPGGTVSVECAEAEDGMVRLMVSDSGRGIAKHKQGDLFMPFARLGAEAMDIEGTGIGLALCKRLVALMEGRIGFESAEGVGSTFWVELPRGAEDPAGAAVRRSSSERNLRWGLDAGGRALLYVEDDSSAQHLMEGIVGRLSNVGMLCADDAEVGLELARKYEPDVIIMDINLPGMSGLEAMKRLKHSAKTSLIPVIALSAAARPQDVALGIEAGFDDYLTKPIAIDEVLETIGKALAVMTAKAS